MKITFKHKYDFVCGIGHYCVTAHFLRRNYLRQLSGPLDWNSQDSGHGLQLVTDLICSSFSGFLEKGSMVLLNRADSPLNDKSCDYYRDEKSKVVFFHDFPLGVPLDESFDAVKAKYDRRIANFYAKIASVDRTLLVFHTRSDHPSDEEMISALDQLRKKLGPQVDLLVIEDVPKLTTPEVRYPADGIVSVRCWFYRQDLHWIYGDIKLTDSIYASIPMRNKLKQRIRFCLQRIRASLYLSHDKRVEARRRLFG